MSDEQTPWRCARGPARQQQRRHLRRARVLNPVGAALLRRDPPRPALGRVVARARPRGRGRVRGVVVRVVAVRVVLDSEVLCASRSLPPKKYQVARLSGESEQMPPPQHTIIWS